MQLLFLEHYKLYNDKKLYKFVKRRHIHRYLIFKYILVIRKIINRLNHVGCQVVIVSSRLTRVRYRLHLSAKLVSVVIT